MFESAEIDGECGKFVSWNFTCLGQNFLNGCKVKLEAEHRYAFLFPINCPQLPEFDKLWAMLHGQPIFSP